MDYLTLRNNIYKSLLGLITEEGINASGKDEIYGCIFGRDSAITILKILKILNNENAREFIDYDFLVEVCRRSLLTLVSLQGKKHNIESGEQPGKFIHEYRKENFDHLLTLEKPWFVYPDKKLRNYDSLDSTPLGLIAIYKYYELTGDIQFVLSVLPKIEKSLRWILSFADLDTDTLVEYELSTKRISGGLVVQSWTDSHESLRQIDGTFPVYPIAPVEVQGYVWLALKLWANFYHKNNVVGKEVFKNKLLKRANKMKKIFNEKFLFKSENYFFPSQALDGSKKQINTVTGNPLLLLWSSFVDNGKAESILDEIFIRDLVARSFMADLFEHDAGIRTMSSLSPTYNSAEDSYHNGSFWPKLNGMAHEGLSIWGFENEANLLKVATLTPIAHFGSPIELYIKNGDGVYLEFKNLTGQIGCREQAWSAAVALDLLI